MMIEGDRFLGRLDDKIDSDLNLEFPPAVTDRQRTLEG